LHLLVILCGVIIAALVTTLGVSRQAICL